MLVVVWLSHSTISDQAIDQAIILESSNINNIVLALEHHHFLMCSSSVLSFILFCESVIELWTLGNIAYVDSCLKTRNLNREKGLEGCEFVEAGFEERKIRYSEREVNCLGVC